VSRWCSSITVLLSLPRWKLAHLVIQLRSADAMSDQIAQIVPRLQLMCARDDRVFALGGMGPVGRKSLSQVVQRIVSIPTKQPGK
jgi:hypothetical protein